MKEQSVNKVKLGAFVLAALLCLVLGLYFIGSNKNIFHSTINVSTNFKNIQGLMPGNNVSFNGIVVGSVSKLYSTADTNVKVEFTIDEDATQYITKSAVISIGTDGLLGNNLLNISPGKEGFSSIEEGNVLQGKNPVQMDKAMETLLATNDNIKVISDNLKNVTGKFNDKNSLVYLLSDSVIAANVRSAVVSFKLTGNNTATISGDLSSIIQDIKAGKGTMGALISDSTLANKLKQTIVNIEMVSDTLALVSGDFKDFSAQLKNGKGAIATLVSDTAFARNLNQSMENIKNGSGNFNDNMKALKRSWFLKKLF